MNTGITKLFLTILTLSLLFSELILAESINGKTVGKIDLVVGDIFYKDPVTAAYQFVNNIKIKTDPEIIRRELLIKEGQEATDFLLAESLRVLRTLPWIREVHAKTKITGDIVDITVYANETWTLIPQLSFSSGDGRDRLSLGLAESNLLGQGNRIEALYSEDDGTEAHELVYDDRRLLGSDLDLTAAIFDRNDGDSYIMRLEKPFRNLVQPTAWSVDANTFDGLGRLYKYSDEDFIYQSQSDSLDASYTMSRGIPEKNIHRFSIGYRYQEDKFGDATIEDIEEIDLDPDDLNQDAYDLASDRRFSGPLLAYSNIKQDYLSLNYIDRFQRVQDINLGDQFGALVHFAPHSLGSYEDTLLLGASRSRGMRFSRESFLRGEITASGRSDSHSIDNGLLSFEVLYYNLLGTVRSGETYLGRHTLGSSLKLDLGHDFDNDRQLHLGADNGLRGYDARTFNGDTRFLLNIEDRVHLAEDVWELFNFGMSGFVDIGTAGNDNIVKLLSDELYGNVGLGLIIGFPRSSGSRVLRLEFAVPFRDDPENTKAFELRLIFSGGQPFDATLRSEERNASKPSVAVGF